MTTQKARTKYSVPGNACTSSDSVPESVRGSIIEPALSACCAFCATDCTGADTKNSEHSHSQLTQRRGGWIHEIRWMDGGRDGMIMVEGEGRNGEWNKT